MKIVGYSFLMICCLWSTAAFAQRGKIIRPATTSVMDPNGDGYVSKTTAGFSGDGTGYYVNEFELTMFGIPILGAGDVTGDNVGNSCGITDLIPDTKGYSAYAVHDSNDNLIFRFRVGDNNPSVEAWTILLDTDGLFGANDPNSTPDNPGFELDITLIKRNNAGVFVYNIDGIQSCPNPDFFYSINSNFQISQADESSCGDPDFFYDYYIPFSALASKYGITSTTGLRFAATTNTSATCAMAGKIADVGGVDNNLPAYSNCTSCAFVDLVNNQCPTALVDLCQTCAGFEKNKVSAPHIDLPLRAGQRIITGTTVESNIYIKVQVFTNTAPSGSPPTWGVTPREEKAQYAVGTVWSATLSNPLLANDKIVAIAQKDEFSVPCGANGDNTSSTSVTVVQPNTPPVANNQTVTLAEDTQQSIVLTATDPENDPLTYSIVSQPTHGVITGSGTNYTYTPNLNYNGSDSFTFQVSDGIFSAVVPGTITLNITAVNDAPIASGQSVTTSEDVAKAITLAATDVDGNSLTYIIVSGPSNGTLSGSGANLTYTPSANYNGPDNFTFKANDGTVDSNVATVSITVTAVNDAPVASAQSVTTSEDVAKVITLVGTDADGNALTYVIVANPAHGTLSGSGANITYTPASNYNGADNFTFKVNDGTVDSNIATVSITVTAVNDAPVANSQSVTTAEDAAKAITLVATDVDGNALTYSIVVAPTHGTLTGTIPNLTYTPAANYNGSDNFTFKANDGTVDSNIATVSITVTAVNDAPVASAQSVTTVEDVAKAITLVGTDVDGNALTYIIVASPAHGTLSGSGANITYTPASNYNGADNFTFKVNDGTVDSNIATVSITVTAVNDAPVANSQSVTTAEDAAKAITLGATDVDGNALTYSIVVPPTHGTLTGTIPNLTYTPAANYNGSDNFTFKANDGTVDSNIATVSITVTAVNDAPVASAQSVTTAEDVAKAITLVGTDVDGNALTYIIIANPAHGTLSGSGANITYTPASNYNGADNFTFKVNDGTVDSNIATVSITVTAVNDAPVANSQSVTTAEDAAKAITLVATDVDGNALTYSIVAAPAHGTLTGTIPNLTYTPAANYNGSDNFTFKANDGTVDSNIATVSITVTAVNDAPVASAQSVTTAEDVAKSITLVGTDVDGNALTYIIVVSPAHGTLSGSGANITYTPASNYNGADNFTFKVNDGTVDSNIATVSITVTAVNDAPVANNQTINYNQNVARAIVLAGSDPEGDPLTFTVVSAPANGTLSGTEPNITYTPNLNFTGSDSFTFKVNDGTTDSNIATIFLSLTPGSNVAPVAINQSVTVVEDIPKTIGLLATDGNLGDVLTYSIVSAPAHGSLSVVSGQNVTYTPFANYNGADAFTFKVNDGTIDSNVGTVSITVTPVSEAPIADDQSVTTSEDVAKAITLTGSSPDGNAIVSYVVVSGPSHGALSGAGALITYTPSANYNGTDFFTFKINDGTDSNVATVSITVTPVNDAPVASAQVVSTNEDTALPITLTGTDVDGDALTFTVASSPAHGVLTGSSPNLIYTPASNYNGSDSFTFTVNDGSVTSAAATVSITVNAVADAPIANDQSVTTAEDTSKPIVLSGSSPDGNAITSYVVVSGPSHGALSGSGANLTYTPSTNYNGADVFTFKVNDGTDSNVATISITVTPVNDAPVASAQGVSTNEDTALPITLTGTDVDGDALTFTVASSPAHGVLTGSSPNVIYTPASNYNGSDSFTFTVNDGSVTSAAATVSITVNAVADAPIANDQSVSTAEDTAKPIVLAGSSPDGNAISSYVVVSGPSHGALSGAGANLTYTPTANYNGSDVFTFKVNDGTDSNIASVSITVTPVNDAPVASAQSVSTNEDTALPITLTGTDVDGDALTFTVASSPAHGVLTGSGPNLIYTPASNYNGSDSFTFTVNDGSVTSAAATVSITVNAVADAPLANDQSVTTAEDTSLPITLTGSSVDGNAIVSYTVVNGPSHGALSGSGANLTYTPSADYNGSDVFTFKVNDGTDSNAATVSITVTPVNDPPITSTTGITVTTNEDTPTPIVLVSTDVDGDPLTYTIVTPPSHGTLSGSGANIFYTPDANYDGPDSFTFYTNDGTVNSNTGTIPITVLPVNDPPVAADDNGTTLENKSVSLTNITSNDTDVDGTVTAVTVDIDLTTGGIQNSFTNSFGSWSVNASGDLTFTPAQDYSGNASISYAVNDDLGATSNAATVTITVIAVTGPPEANSDVATTDEDVAITLPNITSNDVSHGGSIDLVTIDLDPSSAALDTSFTSAQGTWSVDSSGNLTYTPAVNYNGIALIYYTVNDNSGATSNSASVTITVNPVNDAPVLKDVNITTGRDVAVDGNVIDPADADPEGTALTVNTTPVTPTAHGVLTINTDGTFTYTPTAEYVGLDQAKVQVCDTGIPLPAACATKLINFEIKPVNRPPVVIVNNQPGTTMEVTTAEDTRVIFCFQALDPDGDVVNLNSFTNLSGGGTLVPNGNVSFCFQFTPAKDYNGISVWEAQVCDNGSPSLCGKLTVTITITPVNDAPVAVRDSVNVLRKTPFNGNVITNDFDIEGDAIVLSTSPVKDVMHGQFTLESDGSFRYASEVDYRGIDSLVYKICDSGSPMGCSEGTLIINVGDLPLRVYEGVSPNGDGVNEYLRIDGIDYYTENQVLIFDRYNNEVFQITGYNNEDRVWRGQANKGIGSSVLPEGTYFYVITLGDGSAPLNGFVVLKRN